MLYMLYWTKVRQFPLQLLYYTIYFQIENPSKYRVDLRFFADLLAVGVFPLREAAGVLAGQLSLLMNNDKEEHNNLTTITSFCKHCGDDFVGLVPRKYRSVPVSMNKMVMTFYAHRANGAYCFCPVCLFVCLLLLAITFDP